MVSATATCQCGHGRPAHTHYRAGRDCALCACPFWRPSRWWRRRHSPDGTTADIPRPREQATG